MNFKFDIKNPPVLRNVPHLITLVALVLLVLHSVLGFWPFVDITSAALLLIALIPSIPALIHSGRTKQSVKIELSDLTAAEGIIFEQHARVDVTNPLMNPAFFEQNKDANIALTAFALDLERAIRGIPQRRGMRCDQALSQTLDMLVRAESLTAPAAEAIKDILWQAAQAAHGADVDPNISTWVIEQGPAILALLDSKS